MEHRELLRVRGVSKRYGTFQALRDVSFSLSAGETVGLLGRNGAGKSTLIKILCNLVRPDAGEAWLDGQPILNVPTVAHRRDIGAVIEAPRFYPQLSGRANLSMLARLRSTRTRRIGKKQVEDMLVGVGLEERAGVPFGHYSMGMKQRLGLAAAFLHSPRLVILDEPTGGLDPVGQRQIRKLIRGLAGEQDVGVLLCSHWLEEVDELCGRALVLEKGALVLERTLAGEKDVEALRDCFDGLANAAGAEDGPVGKSPVEKSPVGKSA